MARPISVLEVTPEEKRELERRVAAPTAPGRDGMRAHIVLLRSEGIRQREVATRLGVSAPSVTKWSQRFDREGLDGLKDKPGRGAKASIPLATVRRVVEEARKAPPGRQRWSTRSLAREVGISAHSVARIWQNQGLKPHRLRTFKVSRDKKFEGKFWDVVGLYLDPPERSLVLCCDEKTQCQALERTQPGLPLGRGHIRTQTHDYIRHGTVTLFAALSYLEGKLIYRTEQQHTHVEWLRFLKQIDRETPEDVALHLIADNYCTHKHGKVVSWLKKHQRFQMHFIPTSSSWMNMVERFFADLTQDCVRAGSFTSVAELVEAITAYRIRFPHRHAGRACGRQRQGAWGAGRRHHARRDGLCARSGRTCSAASWRGMQSTSQLSSSSPPPSLGAQTWPACQPAISSRPHRPP